MTQEEYKKQLLQSLAKAKTRIEIRGVITEAVGKLENFSGSEKRAFFADLITEAQDNTATMDNAGEAQEIVNQLLNG